MVNDMTDTKKWTFGAALLAVAILVAGWLLLISPKRAEVVDLEAQTATQENANSALETELAVLKQQNKELPEKQAELAALREKIPQVTALPAYIREMQDVGRQSGVAFTSLTPSAPVDMGASAAVPGSTTTSSALTPGALAAINLEMVVTGSYFEITKFMNELETSSRYTLVSGYSITEEAVASEADADTESTSTTQELSATVNARIFLAPDSALIADPGAEGLTSTAPVTPGATTPPATPAPTTAPNS